MLNALQGSMSGSYAPMKRALQPSRELENRPGKAISYVSEKSLLSLESCHLITEQAMVAAKWVSPAQSPHPKVTILPPLAPFTMHPDHLLSQTHSQPLLGSLHHTSENRVDGSGILLGLGLGPRSGVHKYQGGQSPTVLKLV